MDYGYDITLEKIDEYMKRKEPFVEHGNDWWKDGW